VRPSGLLVAWVLAALAFLLLLGYELLAWRLMSVDALRTALERTNLSNEIRRRDEQIAAELRAQAPLLRDMQSTMAGGDPAAFLTRLGEIAGEKRMRVVAVGSLERQATPQFSKSWHAIQVVAPYAEIRDLAERVEGQRGIIEDVRLEPAPGAATLPPGRPPGQPASEDVQARFRMTALELSPAARQILDRVRAAGRGSADNSAAPLSTAMAEPPLTRDPFAFVVAKTPAPVASRPPVPAVDRLPVALSLSAIVSIPGGSLAIVNNQIVRVGDVVSGHRVESITDTAVSLREPGGPVRTIELPDLGAAPPAPPRR